ncbi:MAG: endonuclease/exonuclease/phosphatase family protein [Myxococcota bacterium]
MKKTRLTVLSYNIHKGFSTRNKVFVLHSIKESIQAVHADLVFLQEVLGHHEEHGKRVLNWPTVSQFEFLADKVWPHYAYGKNAVYASGHHGNAILSKYPITFHENVDVSTSKLERRGLLHAVLEVPNHHRPLHAICIHLGLLENDRQLQIARLCERIDEIVPHDAPLVVAGDFNDWRERATSMLNKRLDVEEAFVKTRGAHARTFPSWAPFLRLDRIYYRGLDLKKADSLTGDPWRKLSDHAAVTAELAY